MALAKEFGGSRLDVSIGITLVNIVGAIIAPSLGRLLDKYPIRNVMLFGCVTLSLGFLILAFIQQQWQLYLILASFVAIGSSAMGGLSTAKLVTNWFVKKRGTALGIATMGISLSGVAMPLISAWLIESYGWRIAFMIYSATTLILISPIVIRYVVNHPHDIGLAPDNKLVSSATLSKPILTNHWKTLDALKNRNFWLMVITFSLMFCCMSATLTHMVPRVIDLGFSLTEAAPILSFGAGTGVLGKVVYGWITDHYKAKWAIWIAIVSQVSGQIILLSTDSYLGLAIGAATFGFGMGGMVPIHGAMVSALFGQAGFGFVMGLMRPAMMPIQIAGIPFAGWVFDTYGSYDIAFKTFLILYALAAISVGFIRETPKSAALK